MITATTSIFHGSQQPFTFDKVEINPESLEQNEILVQIQLATICGSDIWSYMGSRPSDTPLTMGHEGVGIVIESRRKDIQPGQRVVWSIVDACGRCPYCTDYDLPQKCDQQLRYGYSKQQLAGTFASHMILRAGTTVLPVSPDLNNALASTLCCAWSTAEACLERLPREASTISVVGLGMVGIAAAFLAQRNGRTVYVLDHREDKQQLAQEIGLQTSIPNQVDAIIEATGHMAPFEQALDQLRTGGTAVIAGLVHPESHLSFPIERLVKKSWTWIGVHNYNPRHLHRALINAHAFQGRIDPSRVFSPAYEMSDIDSAMKEAHSGKWLRVPLLPPK